MEKCDEGFVMEKDFEQWLKDNFYSWATSRIYMGQIRKEYKRKRYPNLESFVHGEIQGKTEIYVHKKAIPAFKKFAVFLAENVKVYTGVDVLFFKKFVRTFEVKEDTTTI